MKIILALIGFFVAAWCSPAPQIRQSCSGANCGQKNAVLEGSKLRIDQKCKGGQCKQSNFENDDDFDWDDSDFWESDDEFGDTFNYNQECHGGKCDQTNQGRKKRASVQVRPRKTLFNF